MTIGGSKSRVVKRPTQVERRELFREDGRYEITFEKVGKQVNIAMDGRLAWQIELSDEEAKTASGRMLHFRVSCSTPRPNHRLHLKATLLEFSCSGDCIHRRPLKPPK